MQEEIKPMVSVWMITYNHEKYISKAIESVLMQKTSFHIELVIGEDFSTDGTAAIVKNFAQKYPEIIRARCNTKNIGMIPNEIKTFQECRGKYIAMLEGDDYWTDENKLQYQFDFLEKNQEYGFVYTDFDRYFEATNQLIKEEFKNNLGYRPNTFNDFLLNLGFLANCTWCFRHDILLNYFDKYNFDLNWKAGGLPIILWFSKVSKVYFLPKSTTVYRVLRESASHFTNPQKDFEFKLSVLSIQWLFAKDDINLTNKVNNVFYSKNFTQICLYGARKLKDTAFYSIKGSKGLSLKSYLLYYLSSIRILNFPLKLYFKRIYLKNQLRYKQYKLEI